MDKDKGQSLVPNEDQLNQKLPDLSALVQRLPAEKPEADVGDFIEEIKNATDLPEDIFSALSEARSRVQMEIPDPPADLWDNELEALAELPTLSSSRPSVLGKDIFPDLFNADPIPSSQEPLEGELDVKLFSALPTLTQAKTEEKEETEETEKNEEKEEIDEEENADEITPSTIAAIPELSEEEIKAKQRRLINPWSLLFGKNNVVDATATLIFLHAVIMLTLEIVWLRLPVEWIGISKNSFMAFALVTSAVQVLALLFPIFLSFNTYRLPSSALMGKTKISRPLAFASVLLGLPAALFFNGINNLFTYALVTLDISLPVSVLPTYKRADGLLELLVAILVAVLLPSLLEELFFRGFVQKALLGLRGPRAAIYLSAIAFAFYHNDPLYILAPFGIGVLLGKLRYKSESIFPSMLASLSIGLTTYFLDPLLPRYDAQMVLLFPAEGLSNLSANLVATISSGLVLFFIYRFISENLLRSRAFTGFATGRRAAIYGRNQAHKEAVLYSPDRNYKIPALTLPNYIRLLTACLIAIISRFLAS